MAPRPPAKVNDWQDVTPSVQAADDWQDVNDWEDSPSKEEIDYNKPTEPSNLEKIGQGIQGVGRGLLNYPKGLAQLSELSPFSSEGNQLQKAKEMFVDPILRQHEKARQDFAAGNTMSGLTRATVGSIPMAGPALLERSEEIQNPETRYGAVGQTIGEAVAPRVYSGAARKISSGVKRVAGAVEEAGTLNPKKVIKTALEKVDNPEATLIKGVKPAARDFNFDRSLQRSMPELKLSEKQIGKPIAGVEDAYISVKHAKQRVWKQYEMAAGPARQMGSTINLSPVADAMEASITDKVRLESPKLTAKIQGLASRYRKAVSLQEAEKLLADTNAELESFYAKYPSGQRSALRNNPSAAYREAQGTTLRDLIYQKLDDATEGSAARELKQRYGSLLKMEQELERRKNVAQRQQPESLSEQIGKWSGYGKVLKGSLKAGGALAGGGPKMAASAAADIAEGAARHGVAKFLKEQQTADSLIRRAFASYDKVPDPVDLRSAPQPKALLNRGPLTTPQSQDTSFVRGVQARPVESEFPRLPAPPPVREMPPIPDTSFVRGQAAPPPPPNPLRQLESGPAPPPQRVPPSGGTVVTPPVDPSGVKLTPARRVVDPKTGKVYYISEPETQVGPPQFAHGGVVTGKKAKAGRYSKRGIWYGPPQPKQKTESGPPSPR